MKMRLIGVGLLFLLLCGCGWIQNESRVVAEHREPVMPAKQQTEDEEPSVPVARDSDTLCDAILSFVYEGSAQNIVDVTNFQGDLSQAIGMVMNRLAMDPVYAYAVDYADYDVVQDGETAILQFNMVYRRSAEEIAAITEVPDMERCEELIYDALDDMDVAVTLKISSYTNLDLVGLALQYAMEHPCQVVELPQITASVYPERGSTRILEMHFSYQNNRDDMRMMRQNVSTVCTSAANYAQLAHGDTMQLTRLCEYLLMRGPYELSADSSTPAYDLLSGRRATDAGFASVFYDTAQRSGLECYLVSGAKDDQPYYWNIVLWEGKYRHLDLMAQLQNGSADIALFSDGEMDAYSWDTSAYPACEPDPASEEPTGTEVSAGPATVPDGAQLPEPTQTEETVSDEFEPMESTSGQTEQQEPSEPTDSSTPTESPPDPS